MQLMQAKPSGLLARPRNQTIRATTVEDNTSIETVDSRMRNTENAKKGHIARVCRSKPATQPTIRKHVTQTYQSRQPQRQHTNLLTDEFPEDANIDADTDPVYSLFTVSHQTAKPLRMDVG